MDYGLFEFKELLEWYKLNGRKHLPWRQHSPSSKGVGAYKQNGYLVWLSEILLQQTQADRVVSFYTKILARYPTVEHLASTDYEEFFPYYQGLGYYSRARNLLACAKIVCEKYEGVFPEDSEALIQLPGIGKYTAEAIRSFAYNKPTLSFDTNLNKIFARYYFGSRFEKIPPSLEQSLLVQLEDFVNKNGVSSADINAAFMDLGSIWSKNSKNQVDFSASPFVNCAFTNSMGALEKEFITKKTFFPLKDAKIIVILHKNHREYYSESSELYEPFVLPSIETFGNSSVQFTNNSIQGEKFQSEKFQGEKFGTREVIQSYFQSNYGLTLSVRPEHKKLFIGDAPYVFVRAQIQQGDYQKYLWHEWKKNDVEAWEKSIV